MHKSSSSTSHGNHGGISILAETKSFFSVKSHSHNHNSHGKGSGPELATLQKQRKGSVHDIAADLTTPAQEPKEGAKVSGGLKPSPSIITKNLTANLSGRSPSKRHKAKSPSEKTILTKSQDKDSSGRKHGHSLSVPSSVLKRTLTQSKSNDSLSQLLSPGTPDSGISTSPQSATPADNMKHVNSSTQGQALSPFPTLSARDADQGRPPGTAHSHTSTGLSTISNSTRAASASITTSTTITTSATTGSSIPNTSNGIPSGGWVHSPNIIYQHINEMAMKRISTLDYLRKAHESPNYWFNTLHFSRSSISSLPSFAPQKLSRRSTNYFLLGLSLPTILDLNASHPLEYLRALNALFVEFETFQAIHPADGSSASSLSRARLPQMFKKMQSTTGRGRRTSSAAEIGLPLHSSDPHALQSMLTSQAPSTPSTTTISFPSSADELLPNEEYSHLLTPSLPFSPDLYETFATLCEVLIDAYSHLLTLLEDPDVCTVQVSEMFTKADSRVRKVLVQGVIKDFEDGSRAGIKQEVAGVGKVVLGGLM